MKKCPHCAEDIQDEAVVCRFCGREIIQENQLHREVIEQQKKGWILLSQTPTAAQLKKPRMQIPCLPRLIFATLAIVGLIILGSNVDGDAGLIFLGFVMFIVGALVETFLGARWVLSLLRRERVMTLFVENGKLQKKFT